MAETPRTIRVLLQIEMVQPQVHPVHGEEQAPQEVQDWYIETIGGMAATLGGTLYVVRSKAYVEAPADPPELPMEEDPSIPPGPFDVAPEQVTAL